MAVSIPISEGRELDKKLFGNDLHDMREKETHSRIKNRKNNNHTE